jgi:ribosomal protein S18 acetylase RimI-like enzyme
MHTDTLQIRRYDNIDHDAVWNLHNLALDDVGAHAGNGPWDEDLHDIDRVYISNGGEFLVGFSQGQMVAMGALMRSSNERAEIKRMRVHPHYQRKGYGRAILQALENRAMELGFTVLHLDTTVQQTAAQSLYEHTGYSKLRQEQIGPFEVILFEKRVLYPKFA